VHDGSLDLIALNNTLNELRFGIVTLQSTLEEASEDVTPQNTPELKGRSRREVIETEIAEALAKEHGT
jgi:hypothetical protein